MAMALHNVRPVRAVNKRGKRVGRGNASGHGTYSTRGIKGQKARSGVSGLKRLGMKQMLLSVPKLRGFKSYRAKSVPVNVEVFNKLSDGQKVTPALLRSLGLVKNANRGIKLLGRGEVVVKNLEVSGLAVSATARQMIEKAGGKVL